MKDFKQGELVKFAVNGGLIYTDDGFAMGGPVPGKDDCLRVYEEIDVETFPSFKDFKGNSTLLYEGDIIVIVKYMGRPETISNDPRWFKYDIYEIMTPNGTLRHVFKQNLRKLQD